MINNEGRDDFKWSSKELSDICHLDNKCKKGGDKSQDPTIISSAMIIEKFGGLEGLASALRTNLASGLHPEEVSTQRMNAYGINFYTPPRIKTLFELVMENFEDTINLILLAAAVVSVVIGLIKEGWPRGLIEGISIMIALVIIITVTSANNWVSERQLADLVAHQELQ